MWTQRTVWSGNCSLQIHSFPVCCFRYPYGSTQLDIYKKMTLVTRGQHLWVVTFQKNAPVLHVSVQACMCSGLSCFSGIFFPKRIWTEILVCLLKLYKISEGNSSPFLYFLTKTSTQYIQANTHFGLHLNDRKTRRVFLFYYHPTLLVLIWNSV